MWNRTIKPAVIVAFVSGGIAHMILDRPKPFGTLTLNNSPLDENGADFPCKQRNGVYDVTEMNYWKVGEQQSVSFNGSAVHGGGSCQFSVTADREPTESSRWKVIHSIVGGCPASAAGNLEAGQQADTFDFLVPADMPSGKYTFAWTWFNRRGRREMYMNCAPISVSGTGENATFLDGFPDMFVANIASTACATVEDFDFLFPQPGDSVSTGTPVTIAALHGTGCTAMGPGGLGAKTIRPPGNPIEGISSSSPDGYPSKQPSAVVIAAAKTPPYVEAARVSDSAAVVVVPVAHTSATIHLSSVLRHMQSGTPSSCTQCSGDGNILCIDDTHYGLCDHGCAIRQPLADGTFCQQGTILKRN
jgi:hypothetical protein